ATGLVTLLILGVHYYWLRNLGPVEVFYNPIPLPELKKAGFDFSRGSIGPGNQPFNIVSAIFGLPGMIIRSLHLDFNFIFNRIVVLVVTGFVLDYLFRRLKRTAEWFT